MNEFVVGVSIFALVYIGIISEKINKTVVALLGAMTMLSLHVLDQAEAFNAIDLNVVFLLVGMMIIVHIMSKTGVFQWGAIKVAQLAKGEPLKMLIYLSCVSAVISAFLDNVTTMILMVPVLLLLCDELELDPIPFLLMTVIASNIGGAATLVGDPPNILIGSAAGLNFNDFLINLAPVIIIISIVFIFTLKVMFADKFHVSTEIRARVMEMRADKAIRNYPLLWKSLGVLGSAIILFLCHHIIGLEAATVALLGASVLLLISKEDPEEVFKHVEWVTLFFFVGLFIIVEGLVKIGFIELLANYALDITDGQLTLTTMLLLWFSAIFSAIIDNIPYTATMIPLVKHMGVSMSQSYGVAPDMILRPLWWALALGACLGGNGTSIGASANVLVIGLAKKTGHHISFLRFLKYGSIFVLESLVISTIYLYIRYLM
ncbi:SLC13 family permease [Candidatus Omnitrophota bacterium]